MWRALDNAHIRVKLLIAPLFAVLALALTCGVAFRGFSSETAAHIRLEALHDYRLAASAGMRLAATRLQADLFRLTSFGAMGVGHAALVPIASSVELEEAALERLASDLLRGITDSHDRAPLERALGAYRAQSWHAVANVLANPGQGAIAARNAAMALDAVISEVRLLDIVAESDEADAEAASLALNARNKVAMLALMAAGSLGVALVNLLVAWRIAEPVRRLTHAMSRLAENHYDVDIPAIAQRDEVGSMARAVRVFREGMLRADALSREQLATQRFLDTVLENVPVPIGVMGAGKLDLVYVNRAGESFLGLPRGEVIGQTMRELYSQSDADSFITTDIASHKLGSPSVQEGITLHTPRNGTRLVTITRVAIAGSDGAPQYLLAMIDDITERQRAEDRIRHMARHDALTDLPNRDTFREQLVQALREPRGSGGRPAVFCLDLDHFKDVNDTLGHAAGDKLLRGLAARMRACLRDEDTLARLGGDEFAVILPVARHRQDVEAVARRLLETTREPFDLDGHLVHAGLSIGVVLATPGMDGGELVKQADLALYEAKGGGRGRVCFFAPEMDARLRHRRSMEQALRAAIGTDQLLLHYQPQVDLATGAIVGVEALMRWNRPGHGAVPPDQFIPLAEETGLIAPLGVWLLDVACQEAARWSGQTQIALNVSPTQFRQAGFLETVKDALARAGLDPRRLEMEVTEGILLHDTAETLAILAELRTLGVRLAMDDFGTGYASLGYLQKFRFDKIKIDKSFIRNLATDPHASAIVRAVVGLSESLGMCTNAEGVEEQEQVDLLRAHGCAEAQGYRFWRPMPAAELRDLLGPPPRVAVVTSPDWSDAAA